MAEQAQALKVSNEVAISIENMNKWYGSFHVLRDIDLTVQRGERIVICGPSGSGKSTLVRGFLKAVGKDVTKLRSIRLVFFLQASDLRQGYRDLLRELCALVDDQTEEEDDDELGLDLID